MAFHRFRQGQLNYYDQIPDDGDLHHADDRYSPHQMPGPCFHPVSPVKQPSARVVCEICEVCFHRNNLQEHKNGKRHQRNLQKQIEELMRSKTSSGQESIWASNSQMNPVAQPKRILRVKKNGCMAEDVSFNGPFFNFKDKDVSADRSERKLRDDTGAKDHGFKVEDLSYETRSFKNKKVCAEGSERKLRDNTGAKNCGFKRKIGEVTKGKYMQIRSEIEKPVKSLKPEVSSLSNSVKSIGEPKNQIGSQTEPSEGKVHHEIQNHSVEINCQQQSIPMVEHTSSGSDAIVIAPLQGLVASQASVCLKCGDKGFSETLVFCKKCQVYALHRYCLDGPVIFYDDITWFCEDCKANDVDTDSHNQYALIPFRTSDSVNLQNDASQALIELTKCTQRVFYKEQQQNICEGEEKLNKDCRPVLIGEANSSDGLVGGVDTQPISDPIWKGSLHLDNQSYGTITGLLAHLSNLACSKVLEETRYFPHVLCADLLQRSAVWPRSFMQCGPNYHSIALYVFPENERVERTYDGLVDDMIVHDLAIRTVIVNAEFLVFPSTVLPTGYRRFQAKYYLWGVFKSSKLNPQSKLQMPPEDDLSEDQPSLSTKE